MDSFLAMRRNSAGIFTVDGTIADMLYESLTLFRFITSS